ncbi:hypothetical protein VUR80DRAFT_457 [Thermomyces stellatus]
MPTPRMCAVTDIQRQNQPPKENANATASCNLPRNPTNKPILGVGDRPEEKPPQWTQGTAFVANIRLQAAPLISRRLPADVHSPSSGLFRRKDFACSPNQQMKRSSGPRLAGIDANPDTAQGTCMTPPCARAPIGPETGKRGSPLQRHNLWRHTIPVTGPSIDGRRGWGRHRDCEGNELPPAGVAHADPLSILKRAAPLPPTFYDSFATPLSSGTITFGSQE